MLASAVSRILLTLVSVLAALAGPAAAGTPTAAELDQEEDRELPPDSYLGDRIAEVVAAGGRLWFRSTTRDRAPGALVSLNLSGRERENVFPSDVFDIDSSRGQLWVVRNEERGRIVKISRLSLAWSDYPEIKLQGDESPLALLIDQEPLLLTSKRVVEWNPASHKWGDVILRGSFSRDYAPIQGYPSVAATEDYIYVGFAAGEWGGGLQIIDRRSGQIIDVEAKGAKRGGRGPLDSALDPVNAVVADPGRPGCVLVAVGITHLFMSDGRILRVCGKKVDVFFAKILVAPQPTSPDEEVIGGDGSEAFFDLATDIRGSIWAVTTEAVYMFESGSNKPSASYDIPRTELIQGLPISLKLPSVAVVRTDINWALSTSGYTPIIAPIN